MAFDSLFIGVSGLESYQSQIDVISNNIANVGTTGYKGQDVTFQDLLYQTQQYESGPSATRGGVNAEQVGLGVKVATIDTNLQQGGLQTTGVNTDLAINGDGYFVLNNTGGTGTPVFTRDGHFQLNQQGLLYDPSSGLAVQGYTAGKAGTINQTGQPGNITIPIGLQSQAVGTGLNTGLKFGATGDQVFDVSMGGNLDQTQWIKEAQGVQGSTSTPGLGTPYTTSTTIYDSLGNSHLATITYTPDATGATQPTVATTANAATNGGTSNVLSTGTPPTGTPSVNGAFTVTVNAAGTGATISDGTNTTTMVSGGTGTLDGVTFTAGTYVAADAGKAATVTITAGKTNLPSSVANASGTAVTPATRWKINVSFADGTTFDAISNPGAVGGGNVTAPTYAAGTSGVLGYAYFDQNGQFINTAATIGPSGAALGGALAGTAVHSAGAAAQLAQGNELNIRSWGVNGSNASQAPTATGAAPATGPIGLDFHQATSLAGSSNANVLSQNGYAQGTLSNITVSQNGDVVGAFTNGQSQTLARVAVATFQNEQGLKRQGSNQFVASANSGLAQYGTAGSGRFGTINAGSLEQSNVSIADEFTKMILAQRSFEANSRSITTADQDLQTVIALKR